MEYITDKVALYQGDCVQLIQDLPDESIGFSIFSPPFSDLYVYSDAIEDMGNCKDYNEFFIAFDLLVKNLYRVIKQGRLVAVHCMDLPIQKGKEGYIGLRDFSGMILKSFNDAGFIYHSRVTIWKNPVTEMQRTKALGLLHKQLGKDSAMSRVGIPDYLMVFRKEGEHNDPIHCNINVDTWQQWASPVWMDIDYSDTLNKMPARDGRDEKHICLAKGSLVLTKRGYVPIEDVVVGDETLTHNARWKRVIATAKTGNNKETVKINAIGVPNLICTPTHKIYSRERKLYGRNNRLISNIGWNDAKDLKGMYVNAVAPPIIESTISASEWWIIGRWVADGHVDMRGHQYFVSIGSDKWEEFKNRASEYIGAVSKKTNCYQVGLKGLSHDARNILSKCGKGASNKMLPYEVISLNSSLSKAFIDGYIAGDGCECRGKKLFSSASRSLLLSLAIIVRKVYGNVMSVYAGRGERIKEIDGRIVHCSQEWVGQLSPNYGFCKIQQDGDWKPVKDVIDGGIHDVYNITVEDDHSYMAEGCVVKNCPLQLPTIKRAVSLWSNPGDVVLTPFLGIGSEVYQSILLGRKGIGFELKESYFKEAVKNVKQAELETSQATLF